MPNYQFETKEFGISETGISFLRSGFNYHTVPFEEIKSVRIKNGKELKNWWLVLIIGSALLTFGIFLSLGSVKAVIVEGVSRRFVTLLSFLFVPMSGAYFIYTSLQTGLILEIEYQNGQTDHFPLKEIIKNQQLHEFKAYLQGKVRVQQIQKKR